MKVTIELTEAEFQMVTAVLLSYVHMSADSVCTEEQAKDWRDDLALAESIRDKFIVATGA